MSAFYESSSKIKDPTELRIGDIVIFRGIEGPKMVVSDIKDGAVGCEWFDKNYTYQSIYFGNHQLERISE